MALATSTMIALGLAAASAAASAQNSRQTAKKQDREAARGIARQGETQRDANARLNKTLEFAKQSKPDDVRKTANDQYLAALRKQKGQATAGLQAQGVSSVYDQAATQSAAQSTDYASGLAGLLSTIDAGEGQRRNEGNAYGNLGMDLDAMSGRVRGDQFLTDLRLRNIRRDPWLDAGAAALSGAAGVYGGRG